jgi:hypothetical protein
LIAKILRVAYFVTSSLFGIVVGVLILWKIYATFGQIETAGDWFANAFFFSMALWMIGGGIAAIVQLATSRQT